MSEAVRVEHLSKEYRLGVINHGMLYKDIQSWIARRLGRVDPHTKIGVPRFEEKKDRFLALKDLSFVIQQGDRLGIIGPNGAGKSTLLKILSRITVPSAGVVKVRGRIASLLEVGTGFHPDLTGRENVYLNGAILGMKRREIDRKFDEIVSFAEVAKFIDTPVKRYSSGMFVRLAFSVAAHLDSEILLADEVLAVGDSSFQRKCLGKMDSVSKDEGRTIVFVSHQMSFIQSLCNTVINLDKGSIVQFGTNVGEIINNYLGSNNGHLRPYSWAKAKEETCGDQYFRPLAFYMTDSKGKIILSPISHQSVVNIVIESEIEELSPLLCFGIALYSEEGHCLFWSYQTDGFEATWPIIKKGKNVFAGKLDCGILNEGSYRLELISTLHMQYWITEPLKRSPTIFFEVRGGMSNSPYWYAKRPGLFAPLLSWHAQDIVS